MNVLALAVPLTRLLTCSHLCAAATARCLRFVLHTSADWQSLCTGDLGLLLVVCAHGSGFPLTDAASHELGAVSFTNRGIFGIRVIFPAAPAPTTDDAHASQS